MKTEVSNTVREPLNVLLVGNNPIEMGIVLEKLRHVRNRKVITEIAFDIRSIVERLVSFKPNFIIIDDNIGRDGLIETVNKLATTRVTKNVPITVLKNSNYRESLASASVLDYLLKQNLSSDGLYNAIKNALRLKRTQRLLYQAYRRKKNFFKEFAPKPLLNLIG